MREAPLFTLLAPKADFFQPLPSAERQIIAIEQERKAFVEKQWDAGEVLQEDKLKAEERVLAAKQKLLELQATK